MKNIRIFASILTLLIIILIWAMAGWALGLKDYEAPEMMIFLGRFHPLVLHLPIGFMVLALLLDIGHMLPEKWRKNLPNTTWLHGLVVLSATGTVIHGILLYAGGGYEGSELANRHLVGGCLFLTVIAAVFLIKLWLSHLSKTRLAGAPMALLAMLVLSISAHDGASLTHGESYLSQYAPEALKPLLEPGYEKPEVVAEEDIVPLPEQPVYTAAVQPIFDRTCVECHKESKKKGKLRMDTYEELMKGGASGEFFVANSVEESLFLQRIHLPMDDDDHMPPEGKKQPTEDEVKVLEWWVNAGAPAEGTLASHNPPAEILTALALIHGGDEAVEVTVEEVVPALSREELDAKIKEFNAENPATLNFVSLKDDELTFSCFSDPQKVDNELLEQLHPFGDYLADINLNRTKVTTSGVKNLLELTPNLKKLSLNDCRISDKITEVIMPLEKLEALSLYGTKITDDALMQLVQLPTLGRLYASNTDATTAGASRALDSIKRLDLVLTEEPKPVDEPKAEVPKEDAPAPKPAPKAEEKPAATPAPATPSAVNLALNKPVTATEVYSPQYPAKSITDGKGAETETNGILDYWLLPNGKTGWAVIDLGKPEVISRVKIQNCKNRQYNDRATNAFRIEISNDGQNYVKVHQGNLKKITTNIPGAHPKEEFKFNPTKGRYLRVVVDSFHGTGGGINEVEVYAN